MVFPISIYFKLLTDEVLLSAFLKTVLNMLTPIPLCTDGRAHGHLKPFLGRYLLQKVPSHRLMSMLQDSGHGYASNLAESYGLFCWTQNFHLCRDGMELWMRNGR